MTKKTAQKSKEPAKKRPAIVSTTTVTGGANVEADQVEVKGDVVGHDKIEAEPGAIIVGRGGRLMQVVVNLPRGVQIAIGVVALAIVLVLIKALIPPGSKVNTEFVFDASAAMSNPERWRIAQTVFGDQATYATRREQLALRKVGGGCDVPHDPLVPLAANQADRLVSAVKSLTPNGDAALVDSIKTAADDLPSGADTQNSIILISAGQDTCLTKQQKDPCTAMSAVADSLNRAGIKFTLHIVALRADDKTRQQLACLASANASGHVYQANSVEDLQAVLAQVERGAPPAQIPENWPISYTLEFPSQVYKLAWSMDGKQILAITESGTLAWDLVTNRTAATTEGGGITGVWSPDGQRIARIGDYQNIVIWNGVSTIELKSDDKGPAGDYVIAWSPDGKKIASGSLDGTVPIWDIASKTSVRLSGHTRAVFEVAWSPDGNLLASASGDGTVRIWEAATARPVQVLNDIGFIVNVAWSPDSRVLATAQYGDANVRIWEAATGQAVTTIPTELNSHSIYWSPDGNYIARGYEIIDARRWQSLGVLDGSAGYDLSSLAWSPNGKQLAISSIRSDAGANHYFIRTWNVP